MQAAATLTYTQNPSPAYDVLSVNTNGCTPTGYCWRQNGVGPCLYTSASILLQNGGPTSYTVDIIYGTCHKFITQGTRFSSRNANNTTTPRTLDESTISPNPASDVFTILLPVKTGNVTATIYNGNGGIVTKQQLNGGANQVNTTNWPSGDYVVKLITANGKTVTKKLIISK